MQVDPEREGVYENLALCYAQIKDYTKSQELLSIAKEKFPNSESISKLINDVNADLDAENLDSAYKAYNAGNYEKAIELYNKLPETNDTLLGLASAYQGLKQDDKAIEYYKKALAKSPNNSDLAYSIGAMYANMQNYEEARKYFMQAVQINPSNLNAKEGIADMNDILSQNNVADASKLIEGQKYDEALNLLNKAISINPNNADAYYYRGSVYDAQSKSQQAIESYKKSLELNQNQDVTYYLIAIDYENLNKPKEALGYYKKFLEVYKANDEYSQYVKARIPEIEADLTPKN